MSQKTVFKRSKTSETQVLPPCKVCGGKAVGFHFGVNICAACKSFFKRMIKKPPPTRACGGNCETQPGRAQCIYCRYNRCIQAGMSTVAAKRGRYSQNTKIENMIAAQTSKETPQLVPKAVLPEKRKASTSESSLTASSGEESASPGTSVLPESSDSGCNSLDLNMPNDEEMPSPANFDDFNAIGGNTELTDIDVTEIMPEDMGIAPGYGGQYRSNVQPDQLEGLTDFIERIFTQYAVFFSEQRALDLRTRYKEEKILKKQLFGSLKPVDWPEYKRIYEETGLDIDGRQEVILNCIKGSQRLGERYLSFCMDIPGFKDLPIEDQNGVIMNNHFLFAMIVDAPYINVEERIYASPMKDYTLGEEEMLLYGGKEDVDFFFDLMGRLQSFHFTTTERALVTAALLLNRDNGRTERGKAHLEHAQNVLLDALQLQYSKTHPNCPSILQQTIDIMENMRSKCLGIFKKYEDKFVEIMENIGKAGSGEPVKKDPEPSITSPEVPKDKRVSIEDTMLMKMLRMTDPANLTKKSQESKD